MDKNNDSFSNESASEDCAPFHPGSKFPNVTVSDVLDRLCVHGSVQMVTRHYQDLTEDQVKEAIYCAAVILRNARFGEALLIADN